MPSFEQQWTLETALQILKHPTVDSAVWAEAVEWLLVYGPPELRDLLVQASSQATGASFPQLKAERYAPDGSPYYEIAELADALGISEEEARAQLMEKEHRHGVRHGFDEEDTFGLQ